MGQSHENFFFGGLTEVVVEGDLKSCRLKE
jgi:hypothetical protein